MRVMVFGVHMSEERHPSDDAEEFRLETDPNKEGRLLHTHRGFC